MPAASAEALSERLAEQLTARREADAPRRVLERVDAALSGAPQPRRPPKPPKPPTPPKPRKRP